MKLKDFIKQLQAMKMDEAEVLLSSDEELNQLFKNPQMAELTDMKTPTVVLWGNSNDWVEE